MRGSLSGRRVAVAVLSVLGFGIATYLALFQAKVLHAVWDPLPGRGSAWILRRSPLVRWLGFPDAALGIVAYAAEVVLDVWGGEGRASEHPTVVAALGVLAGGMAAVALVLVALQAIFGHWCLLCLGSAVVSLVIAAVVEPEVGTAIRTLRARRPDAPVSETRRDSPVRTG